MEIAKHPRVGVGVFVRKDGKILLGKRKGAHGVGHWAFPGGHLEFGESIEDCARREVMEETGLEIINLKKVIFTNDVFAEEGKHYVTLFVIADYQSGELEVKEPEKCDGWEWVEWEKFPEPLFLPIKNLKKEGFDPAKY